MRVRLLHLQIFVVADLACPLPDPIFEHCQLSTMLTVVDSPHFFELYSSKNDVGKDFAAALESLGGSVAPERFFEPW
jgi:hypothetical protein